MFVFVSRARARERVISMSRRFHEHMYHNFYVPRRVAAPCLEVFPLNNNGAKEIKRYDRHTERQTKIKGQRKRK